MWVHSQGHSHFLFLLAEDLVQGPTGPEGPTPGYKFYWPEVVVVGGTGTVSSCTGVFMV